MVAAPQFYNVLEILGGTELAVVEESKHWNLCTVTFRTPADNIKANYLYLAADCPYSEATSRNLDSWRSIGTYTVVTTRKSRLSGDLSRTAEAFGARAATTPRRLLIENIMQSVHSPARVGEEYRYFVEPEIAYIDAASSDSVSVPALTHIVKLLAGEDQIEADSSYADILVAPAGQGKTTLCRAIANKIRLSYPDIIPVLVESNQWQKLIELTLPNVLNAALLQMIPGATQLTSPKVFQILVREKILVPIFDGFDELSLHPNASYTPATLLSELMNLIGGTEARVLVTVREAFWEKHVSGIPKSVTDQTRRLDLQGFSNQQRHRFFQKRLRRSEERDIANRLSREIGTRLYEGVIAQPAMQADRASGIPLMLELIALYVDGNPGATFAPKTQDALGPLLEAVCERENVRQKLDIPMQTQMLVFENLFRDYADDIPREELSLYVEEFVSGISEDRVQRFESHAFLSTTVRDTVIPRFETLRVYFVARWLANQLEGARTKEIDPEATRLLALHGSGSSDIFDYLADRFAGEPKEKVFACISHACQMVGSRSGWEGSSSALFHLCMRVAHRFERGRRERTEIVFELMLGTKSDEVRLDRVAIQGQVSGLDLSGKTFSHCELKNVEFYNCSFNEGTAFIRSRFTGDITFTNCSDVGLVELKECKFSDAALLAWEERRGHRLRSFSKEENARNALRDILRKFEQQFGFGSIKYGDRDTGPISRNPCKEKAWTALTQVGIIERHRISGVSEGGLNVVNDGDVRHEVRNFLDNAAMGQRLRKAFEQILA